MNYIKYIVGVLVILGIAGILWRNYSAPRQAGPGTEANTVRQIVTSFGKELSKVSLLAPESTRSAEMESAYKPYLTTPLLENWKKNPGEALGRNTSSPFPDRIEIVSVSPRSLTSYTVEGNIIEVANGSSGTTTTAVQPVTLVVEKSADTWLIGEASKGSYSTVPREITVTGTYTCLPHKNTEGPQTLECALGIQATSGEYYSVDTGSYTGNELNNAPTGKKFTIKGLFTPVEMLSSERLKNYNVRGILTVREVTAN